MDSIALIRHAQAGDGDAYSELLGRFHGRVTALVRARLGEGMRSIVESGDVVNDAMIQAIKAFDRFDMRGRASLLRWFAVIVENRIRTLARYHGASKRDHQRAVPLGQGERPGESQDRELSADGHSPLSDAVRSEQRERLMRHIDELQGEDREIIRLRLAEGLRWEEVSKAVGNRSTDSVRQRYARALVQIKKAMERKEGPGRR